MNQITIGRSEQSSIVVPSQFNLVSRTHATITLDGNVYMLEDHSTNGTYVNGTLIHHASCQICPGDNITLGQQFILNFNDVRALLELRGTVIREVNTNINNAIIGTPNPEAANRKPECFNKFNWGAFWFTWIWGIANGVWISLLCLIPAVSFVMLFILGFKGNEWAWEVQKKSKSPEEFDRSQHAWAKAGWIFLAVSFGIVFIIGLVSLV